MCAFFHKLHEGSCLFFRFFSLVHFFQFPFPFETDPSLEFLRHITYMIFYLILAKAFQMLIPILYKIETMFTITVRVV